MAEETPVLVEKLTIPATHALPSPALFKTVTKMLYWNRIKTRDANFKATSKMGKKPQKDSIQDWIGVVRDGLKEQELINLDLQCLYGTVLKPIMDRAVLFTHRLPDILFNARSKERPKFWSFGNILHSLTHRCHFPFYFAGSLLLKNIQVLAEGLESWGLRIKREEH